MSHDFISPKIPTQPIIHAQVEDGYRDLSTQMQNTIWLIQSYLPDVYGKFITGENKAIIKGLEIDWMRLRKDAFNTVDGLSGFHYLAPEAPHDIEGMMLVEGGDGTVKDIEVGPAGNNGGSSTRQVTGKSFKAATSTRSHRSIIRGTIGNSTKEMQSGVGGVNDNESGEDSATQDEKPFDSNDLYETGKVNRFVLYHHENIAKPLYEFHKQLEASRLRTFRIEMFLLFPLLFVSILGIFIVSLLNTLSNVIRGPWALGIPIISLLFITFLLPTIIIANKISQKNERGLRIGQNFVVLNMRLVCIILLQWVSLIIGISIGAIVFALTP